MDSTKRYERAREKFLNGGMERRSFLGLIGAAGLAYGVQTPFAGMARAAAGEVRFDGWGGVVSEAFRKHICRASSITRAMRGWASRPS